MLSKISNISFKSTPIYDVKVKKKENDGYKTVDAVFSKLNPDDEADRTSMEILNKNRRDTIFTDTIIHNFLVKTKYMDSSLFYALELKGNEPLDERIIALSEVSNYPKNPKVCHIDYLQSLPNYTDNFNQIYKGSGELMMYGIVRESQRKHGEYVELTPVGDAADFYEHIGFIDESEVPKLENEKYEEFLSRIEKKYGFSSEEE